ncbi:MAG: hypothetical protein IKV75_05720 [Bacteroidales bacterium]|nr:hypothetical protein [Bacteroidales bacterium]
MGIPVSLDVIESERKNRRREDVLRIVEAQIQGGVDLSPEEMVDAAFIIINKVEDNL